MATVRERAHSSAWDHIFKFQKRGPPRRRARKLLSPCHSRECTKEPISALPNYGSKEKFGAKAELRNILQEKKKMRGRGGSSYRFDRKIGKKSFFCGQCNTGLTPYHRRSYPLTATVRAFQAFIARSFTSFAVSSLVDSRQIVLCVHTLYYRRFRVDFCTRRKAQSVGLELAKSALVVTWYEVKSLLIDRRGYQYYDTVQLTAASEDHSRNRAQSTGSKNDPERPCLLVCKTAVYIYIIPGI